MSSVGPEPVSLLFGLGSTEAAIPLPTQLQKFT